MEEKLDKLVTPSLDAIARALRTGQKGGVDPARSSILYTQIYNATVRAGNKNPRDIQHWITRWCIKDLQANVAGNLRNVPLGEEGDARLFGIIANEFNGYKQIIKTLRFLFSLALDNTQSSKLTGDPKSSLGGSMSATGGIGGSNMLLASAASGGGGSSATTQQQQIPASEQCALKAFYDVVFQPVEARLRNSIFVQLDKIRDGVAEVDRGAIRNATSAFERMSKVLCVTHQDRENAYSVSFARPYYERIEMRVHQDYINFGQQEYYVQFLLERRELENQLAKLCLNASSAPRAVEVFDSAAVARRYVEIMNHPHFGLETSLDEDRFDSSRVANLYNLFWKMSSSSSSHSSHSYSSNQQQRILDAFCSGFSNAITRDLNALRKQWEESTQHETSTSLAVRVAKDLLTLLRRKELVVKTEFCGNVSLERQKQFAFVHFLNPGQGQNKLVTVPAMARSSQQAAPSFVFPQLLAHYVDNVLRELGAGGSSSSSSSSGSSSGGGHSHAADDSAWADPISQLFSLVQDKDLFAEYFRLQMSRRLLSNYVDDNERAVLSRFQRQNGKVYTHKFEGMMSDLAQALQLQNEYENAFPVASTGNVEFHPKILTAAFWPAAKRDEGFIIPDSLAACQEVFSRFYRRKFPTRQLRWQSERGAAAMSIHFPKGNKEISGTVFQAAVLIAIDTIAPKCESQGVPLSEICRHVGLPMDDVKPLVASMLFARGMMILRRVGVDATSKLEETNCFEMNPIFTTRVKKFKLASATAARAAAEESVGAEKTVDAARAQMLDAVIVRVMKSRKTCRMEEIVQMTIQSCLRFFTPQPRQIKVQVAKLIDKEFLERDEKEIDVIRYLA